MDATALVRTSTVVSPADRLEGELVLPGDKSVSHRALMLGLLSEGTTSIVGLSDGADVKSTASVVRALGAEIREHIDPQGVIRLDVESPGMAGLRAPTATLDCGNSGTSLRLFAGILAGHPFEAVLDGDASLRSRPMARIIEPLRSMGADLEGSGADGMRAPVRIRGRAELQPIDWTPSVPSAQVKSAILLAGLRASGTTRIRESVATRDHTERMLRERGVNVRTAEDRGGWLVEVDGGQLVGARDHVVPGDPSAAMFWLVAGAIHRDAAIVLNGVCFNPTRRVGMELLERMGANIIRRIYASADARTVEAGEEIADLEVQPGSELRAVEVSAAETAAAIDEIPVLCLAATQAQGRTVIRGAAELRHKESDRIAGIVAGLRAMGATIDVDGDDILIDGPTPLRGATVDSLGDHRLAMTFAIAALAASGQTTIIDADSVGISYPLFFADLERIQS